MYLTSVKNINENKSMGAQWYVDIFTSLEVSLYDSA